MSESARDKLRRLRAARPADAADLPTPAPALPAWLAGRLAARSAAGRSAATGSAGGGAAAAGPDAEPAAPAGLAPARDVGTPAALAARERAEGTVRARERDHAPEHVHGDWRLAEALEVDPEAFALACADPSLAGLDLSRAVFLDTETSGLAGGAGTWVFLVGLGTFERGPGGALRFRLWQGFLADPDDERALLAETAERLRAASGVVSFFGKSFDRHRLEDKMRLHGIAPPFADRPHLDLYHPLRRLYGGALPDGRLRTVERALCAVERADDLPGAFAPEAWFDFLAGRAHRLEGVFRHNADDVLSLATLAAHLGRALVERRADGGALAGCGVARARALARRLAERREHAAALGWLERARARLAAAGAVGGGGEGAPPEVRELDGELALAQADGLRRLGRGAEAVAALEPLAAAGAGLLAARAHAELARLFERALGDRARALAHARAGLERLEQSTGARPRRLARELEARAARLAARADRA